MARAERDVIQRLALYEPLPNQERLLISDYVHVSVRFNEKEQFNGTRRVFGWTKRSIRS